MSNYFTFDPQTEEQVLNLLPEGEYSFLVDKAEIKNAKSDNTPMIKLTLHIEDSKNIVHAIIDYLTPKMMYKVKHFCETVGLDDAYQSGQFSERDCVGKTGKCKIKVDPATEQYQPKNSVRDYVKTKSNLLESGVPFEDDKTLPF